MTQPPSLHPVVKSAPTGGVVGLLRRLAHNTDALVFMIIFALLAAIAIGAAVRLRTAPPGTVGERFVPADGTTRQVGWQQQPAGKDRIADAGATVQNALLYGWAIESPAVSSALLDYLKPPPGSDIDHTQWWRETIAPTSFRDPTARVRLRSVTPSGIRLHAQDWGSHGFSLNPAPMELPTDARIGLHWTDRGRAALHDQDWTTDYVRTASIVRPDSDDDAAAGCLTTRSTTRFSSAANGQAPQDWTEDETWCPGRGVIRTTGHQQADGYAMSAPKSGAVPIDVSDLDPEQPASPDQQWTARPRLRSDLGDETFGPRRASFEVRNQAPVAADSNTAFQAVGGNGTDVALAMPVTYSMPWQHLTAHPGGKITALTNVGYLTVVASTDRVLQAYDAYGRMHWSAELPDVSVVTATPVPGGRLLATTVRGDVLLFDARDGRRLWTTRLSGSITVAAVVRSEESGGGIAVVPTDAGVYALDLRTGHIDWQQDINGVSAVAITRGRVAVLYAGGVIGMSAADGGWRWVRATAEPADRLVTFGARFAIGSTDGTRLLSPVDGRVLWRRPGRVSDLATTADRLLVLGPDRVEALDGVGHAAAEWPARVADLGHGRLLITPQGFWTLGVADDQLAGWWTGPRESSRS